MAVTLVVAGHSSRSFPAGGVGVDIFFVVSGFIIATVSPGRTPQAFLFRRFWRIFPIYWLLSIPLLLLKATEWPRVAASLSLWPIWEGNLQYPYLPVAWTLYCEVLFYVGAAIAMFDWRVPLVVFGIAMFVNGLTGDPLASHLGNPMFLEFLAGVFLTRVPRRPSLAAAGFVIAIGWLVVAPSRDIISFDVLTGAGGFSRVFWWGVPAILIAYAALTFDTGLSRAKWAVGLGDASFSIYLVFLPITVMLSPYGGLLAFTTAMFAGLVVHKFVELPLLSMRPEFERHAIQRSFGDPPAT